MKLALLVPLVVLAACKANPEDYPQGGGPGGSGSGGAVDAATDSNGDAGPPLQGRVCVVTDLRRVGERAACANTGVMQLNLTVSLGTKTAMAGENGSFTIAAPLGSSPTWHVTGLNYITSVMPFGADNTIPVINDLVYGDLLNTNLVMPQDQQGAVVVRVVKAGVPLPGVVATSNPAGNRLALYDSTSLELWNENVTGTGAKGVVWFADVPLAVTPPSTATIALTPPPGRGSVVRAPAPVENGAITFVTVELP
jgi:hypothetical protein